MRIITKFTPLLIIAVSLYLRVFAIWQTSEFLGDQGRTGIVVYEAWKNKTLPLVGPTVLTGQHLGPIWYYLIGPFYILAGFNPLGPAIAMALYGTLATLVLYFLAKKLFDQVTASFVAILWAVSPLIVRQDQTIWEPNLVPLFVLLFLYAVISARLLLIWIATSILVQLHYPNLIFIPIAFILARHRMLVGILLFFLIQLPFLIYEVQHGFSDVLGVLRVMGQPSAISKTQFLYSFLDYTSRVFFRVIPTGNQAAMIVIQVILFGLVLVSKRKLLLYLLGFYFVGIAAMARYQGLVHDHYLNFLLPIPFLLLGNALHIVRKFSPLGALITSLLIVGWQVTGQDFFPKPRSDIYRTLATVRAIELDTNSPFSFRIISQPSYSDQHYRYFFLISGSDPMEPDGSDVSWIYLICESGSICPAIPRIVNFRYKKTLRVLGNQIFVFGRDQNSGLQ